MSSHDYGRTLGLKLLNWKKGKGFGSIAMVMVMHTIYYD